MYMYVLCVLANLFLLATTVRIGLGTIRVCHANVSPLNFHQDLTKRPARHLFHLNEQALTSSIHVVFLFDLPQDCRHEKKSEEAPVGCHVISGLQVSTASGLGQQKNSMTEGC